MAGRRRRTAFAAVAALAIAIGIAAYATDLFAGSELDTVDARFAARGTQGAPDDVAVVAIDDHTFSALDEQWPLPRHLHGRMIDILNQAGAKSIAYDVQFTEPTKPAEDNALIKAVRAADGSVVLGTTEVDDHGHTSVFGGDAVVRSIGARAANTQMTPDTGGVYRRLEPAIRSLETFAPAAVEVAGERTPDALAYDQDGAWIDFAGPPRTIDTYSFARVLHGKVDPSKFAGRIVVVGATAPTLQDVHATAAGHGLMAGPELQANAIETVRDGLPLRSSGTALDLFLIGVLGLVGPVAGYRGRPVIAFAIAVAIGAAYLLVAQIAFNGGHVIPIVDPLLALVVGAVGMLALHYLLAAFDRQRARDTFARFVPADVVDQVLAETGGGTTLGGVRRECTVLFSDIRGFTSYSESRQPAEVVEVLNRYLGAMTDAIMNHGGTLVAYMGDGIMAVFGAPIEQPDHADRRLPRRARCSR